MKIYISRPLSIVLFLWLNIFVVSAAKQYCQEPITANDGKNTALLSLKHVSGQKYAIVLVAQGDLAFASAYNVNCGVNQTQGAGIHVANEKWVFSADGKTASAEFETASATSLPTNLYATEIALNKKVGDLVEFNLAGITDIDWTATCGEETADTEAPVMGTATFVSATETSITLAVTATDNVSVMCYHVETTGVSKDFLPQDGNIVITGLTANTTYTLVVTAKDAAGNVSANSASVTFTTENSSVDIEEGQCNFFGSKGDGQKHDSSFSPFTTGYKVSLYLNSTKDSIWITAESMDTDQTATSALMQNYPNRKEAEGVEETRLDRVGDSQVFKGKVSIASFKNRADGIIRFGIKFEYPNGGIRVTTPEFYYLDGSGCAERDFVIYHHDQMPPNPERDAVYTFEGGRILQPIVYKRKLKPGIWETLSLPFDVSKITVSDEEGEYELHAQYTDNNTTHEGEFWLRNFREAQVSAEAFQQNWHDIEATSRQTALPKRNVPYIIRVPDGDYYADRYIVFHGEGYQTIDTDYPTNVQVPEAENMFAYSGNNTMKQWKLRSAYVLDNEGIYFESGETVILYPFECAVNAEIETTRAMPRLALNRKPATPTGNTPPTTTIENGSVWSVAGWCAGTFCNTGEYDTLLQRLPAGLYIVRQGAEAYKVYITR